MAEKTWVHLGGAPSDKSRTVRELILLDAALVPGEDVFTPAFAADMVDVSSLSLAPEVGWSTADGGKTFAAPPAPPPVPSSPRTVRGALLVKALDKTTKVYPRDLAYVAALDAAREDMDSILRIAKADGRDTKAWFDAALGVAA